MTALLIISTLAIAQTDDEAPAAPKIERKKVTVAVRADRDAIQAGKEFHVVADFTVPKGTHFFGEGKYKDGKAANSNGIGVPAKWSVKAPDGFAVGKPVFPPTEIEATSLGQIEGYYKDTKLTVPIVPPVDLEAGAEVVVEASVEWQYCDEKKCYAPKTTKEKLVLKVVADAAAVKVEDTRPTDEPSPASMPTRSEKIPDDLAAKLGLAFLAGLFLNVMPCVLPVIAIKVLGFVQHAGESKSRVFMLHLVYALGVIAVFLVLGFFAVWIGLNWGQQFQSRAFSLAMIYVVFAMGLSLLGVFEIPIPGFIGSAAGHSVGGFLGVFLSGGVTTLLATPCTGPFLGPLLGWSLGQMPLVSYMIWGTVGLGMASPYLLFGVLPGAVKLLPKPGDWMVTFKQLAGFAMLATAIFLLNAIKIGTSEEASQQKEVLIRALFLMLGLGFAGWAVGSKITVISASHERWTWRGVAALGLAAFVWFPNVLFPKKLLDWQPFSESRLQEYAVKGTPVLIDFTADWCANCRTNEALAIETAEVADFLAKNGVMALYADYTNYSPEITKWIREFGSDGIPLTVVIGPGGLKDRIVLDGLFGKQRLLDALANKAKKPAVAKDVAAR